jgi:hypothetical protein
MDMVAVPYGWPLFALYIEVRNGKQETSQAAMPAITIHRVSTAVA